MANGQLGLTIDDVTAAVTLSPESAELYLLRAQVYLRTETPTEAVPDLEQVLSLTDDEALTLTVKRYLSLLQ
jgi:Flp pilus assembly protein TadD